MKCIEYEIRVRTLGSGLYNAVPALKIWGRKGTTLTEFPVECCSGPCTSRHLAERLAEERTRAYLANQYACRKPVPLPAMTWTTRRARERAIDLRISRAVDPVVMRFLAPGGMPPPTAR